MSSTGSSESLFASVFGQPRWRLVLVFGVVGLVGVLFLATGGWFSRGKLTPVALVDTFERLNGAHPGFRRNHAKGVGVRGTFASNGRGVRWSKATVFQAGSVPVIGRFALAGGMPAAADAEKTVRSMALEFSLPNGEAWRTGMNSIPVFPVRTPEAFHEQLIAMAPEPATGKPNPERRQAFFKKYPEAERAVKRIQAQKPTAGFAESTYNALNAFLLVDADGRETKVRWSMVPEPDAGAAPAAGGAEGSGPAARGNNFLFDALIARLGQSPLKWHLVLTLGRPEDPTNDASVEWPPDRERVDVGTLTLDRIEGEATSPARPITFDPLVLPSGIRGSDDPLLSARSAVYSVALRRRAGEPVSPSAVVVEGGK